MILQVNSFNKKAFEFIKNHKLYNKSEGHIEVNSLGEIYDLKMDLLRFFDHDDTKTRSLIRVR